MADFYLTSTEMDKSYTPRACTILKRVSNPFRDDIALVRIVPPLPKEIYKTAHDLDELLLASRLQGSILFPFSQSPVYVYICELKDKNEVKKDFIEKDNLTILDWGEVTSENLTI